MRFWVGVVLVEILAVVHAVFRVIKSPFVKFKAWMKELENPFDVFDE